MAINFSAIQACLTNRLDPAAVGTHRLAGVIGDSPSRYSKSPALWNAAFHRLGIQAAYLAFDVAPGRLKDLASALRDSPELLGCNVTVPHKQKIIEHLDELDRRAARIQAVNTIVRTSDGRLLGYNTDGGGFLESLRAPEPGQAKPFVESFRALRVMILGAGGSARAIAFALADLKEIGEIVLCNRTMEAGAALARDIAAIMPHVRAVGENDIAAHAATTNLIVNCTVKGQGGVREDTGGNVTMLEPYSALAAARPKSFPVARGREADFIPHFEAACREDIDANNDASMATAISIPKECRFYDLVYHPEETIFLRHGRITGHRTMNGKAMIVWQAALAFCHHICERELEAKKLNGPGILNRVAEIMFGAW
jgi:shikimate dehydrogenase